MNSNFAPFYYHIFSEKGYTPGEQGRLTVVAKLANDNNNMNVAHDRVGRGVNSVSLAVAKLRAKTWDTQVPPIT